MARMNVIKRVETEKFFFLDDDDDLPKDYLDVLEECDKAQADIAYTDELITYRSGAKRVDVKGPYSREAHGTNAMLLHHLVLCDTRAARAAVRELPRGDYCPEMLLYGHMARGGAAYIPRVGYHWNKLDGLHRHPSVTASQQRTWLLMFGGST